ncbi:sigma-70 family RNA polymerase sigma factor [Crossiella cryophila]|uniref:RNA polymerase sigma-70 factor (ECF subfamily) n=1 Tax=Crossiella cryophila TaxID=43355 RepID=A0A7W7C9I0_9PSEU|nr:sigma-70 family RNA polymerase sigma factor [Crossiella cryophila]MBB4677039.1 RNA polymerase sigma-70 factor (ECF subfamily) [Crossiella cryophila]
MTRADTELLAAAARGDDAAFDDLVRRHTTRMYRIALRIVGDPAEAEDVVQDAWVSAWRGLAKFRGEAAPTTWLFRVVTNTALAHLRRRQPTVPLDGTAEPVMTDVAADPERAALRNEQTDLVLRAIATLEPSQRVPLVLRELEELSYEEVAEVLDVPVPTLRSRLYRARVALLAKLEELR